MILTYQEKQPVLSSSTRGTAKFFIPNATGQVLDYRLIRSNQTTKAGDPRATHRR